jgi:hypothetical protein
MYHDYRNMPISLTFDTLHHQPEKRTLHYASWSVLLRYTGAPHHWTQWRCMKNTVYHGSYDIYAGLPRWPLKMGPICCPETSVYNYHNTPRNIWEERRSRKLVHVISLIQSVELRSKELNLMQCVTEWLQCVLT